MALPTAARTGQRLVCSLSLPCQANHRMLQDDSGHREQGAPSWSTSRQHSDTCKGLNSFVSAHMLGVVCLCAGYTCVHKVVQRVWSLEEDTMSLPF